MYYSPLKEEFILNWEILRNSKDVCTWIASNDTSNIYCCICHWAECCQHNKDCDLVPPKTAYFSKEGQHAERASNRKANAGQREHLSNSDPRISSDTPKQGEPDKTVFKLSRKDSKKIKTMGEIVKKSHLVAGRTEGVHSWALIFPSYCASSVWWKLCCSPGWEPCSLPAVCTQGYSFRRNTPISELSLHPGGLASHVPLRHWMEIPLLKQTVKYTGLVTLGSVHL